MKTWYTISEKISTLFDFAFLLFLTLIGHYISEQLNSKFCACKIINRN